MLDELVFNTVSDADAGMADGAGFITLEICSQVDITGECCTYFVSLLELQCVKRSYIMCKGHLGYMHQQVVIEINLFIGHCCWLMGTWNS